MCYRIRDLDQSPRLAVFGGPSSTFCAFVSRPFVAHNCTSMRGPFFHGNAALSRAMTQAFGPRARSCAFGARTELIIGTWNGSAAGSLGGEADARPRAPPQLILSVSLSFSHALSRCDLPSLLCIISAFVSISFCLVMNVHLIVAFAWTLRSDFSIWWYPRVMHWKSTNMEKHVSSERARLRY